MSDLEQHAVTPAEWNLLMRLDDALPKGTPDHRLVIETGMALVLARHEAVATYLASPEAEQALAKAEAHVKRLPQWSCLVDHRDGDGNPVGCPDAEPTRRRAILAAMRAEASE